jgi:hypothetical protein
MGLHIGQDHAGHDGQGDMGLHIGQDHQGSETHDDMGLHSGQGHVDFSVPDPAQPYQDLVAQSQTADHHDWAHADAGAASFEHAQDFTSVAGEHHGDISALSPASEYLALAQPHEGDAGQFLHGAGHEQGAPEYTQMASSITPQIDHQPPIAPDQLLAEIGGAHGTTDVDHGLQPVQHEDAAASNIPAMETPIETDHGHHG